MRRVRRAQSAGRRVIEAFADLSAEKAAARAHNCALRQSVQLRDRRIFDLAAAAAAAAETSSEPPGGMTCAEAPLAKISAAANAPMIDACFIQGMS